MMEHTMPITEFSISLTNIQDEKLFQVQRLGKGIEPPERITEERVQEMIDDAIRKHNRNASIISMCVGWVVLALFAEGLLRLIGVIPPAITMKRR